ncbi:hypothetical protein CMO89_00150 [Candidatus Woesearchaeota archaeon]|nr:hypothetical protein [Candidatus Woesearchaeota archaeon]
MNKKKVLEYAILPVILLVMSIPFAVADMFAEEESVGIKYVNSGLMETGDFGKITPLSLTFEESDAVIKGNYLNSLPVALFVVTGAAIIVSAGISSLILGLTLLTFAVGCARIEEGAVVDWHSGFKGVEMNFMEGAPPRVVYDNDSHDVMLEAWNKGTSLIDHGTIYLSGYDSGILTALRNSTSFNFTDADADRKSEYNPEGGYTTVNVGKTNVTYNFTTGALNTKIKATAVYPYTTEFSTDVCVDRNPYTPGDKVCEMAGKATPGGQGAPVAVTNIEPQAMKDKVRFKITFRNAGNGEVIDKAKTGTNPSALNPNDYDYVNISESKLGGTSGGSCQPTNVKLVNGQGFTFCTFDVSNADAYITRLDLKLKYGYISTTEIGLEVRSSPRSS